ncbi:acyltransferase [Hymenobacter sp. DH14]|uniref:Acyltransferase n=1 Tax=Hymenobacter cyanobacteriorum TaxID=2926463 RepID=A0A9X2AI19_9BACT|nr:acyltransferase [Hymenobacter cyanobacteriorum]MCI1189503.1 acyltransferase [Hymenobacter cyanobacteriorum]
MTNPTAAPASAIPAHLPGLDHLRALAIGQVLLFHYRIFPHPEWLDAAGQFGWTGVDLFFVLSGYLIAAQLLRELARRGRLSLAEYFIKRTFRILPAYLVVVALYFGVPAFREREALPPLWKFLTFTQNFGLDLHVSGTFSHAWSLCVEEQFYLLLPLGLLALAPGRRGRWAAAVLPALVLLGFGARLLSWYGAVAPQLGTEQATLVWYKYLYYPTYNRLDGLLVGIAIAALFHCRPQVAARLARHGNRVALLGLVVLAGAFWVCREPQAFGASIFGFPLVALGYGLLVAAALSPGSVLHGTAWRVSAKVAALSFAIYLTHKGVFHLTQAWFSARGIEPESNAMLLLCLATVLAGAELLHAVVEKPFLQLRQRLLMRRRTGRAPVPAGAG